MNTYGNPSGRRATASGRSPHADARKFPARSRPLPYAGLAMTLLLLLASDVAMGLAPGQVGVQVTIPISEIADSAQAVALDPNGNIVLAGTAGSSYSVLVRLQPNGVPDPSFGGGGIFGHDLSVDLGDGLRALVRIAGNRYVGCGFFDSPGTARDFVVARFTSNGSLDSSFNGAGFAVTPFANSGPGEQCNGVAVQSDEMIVSVGYTHESGPSHVAITRHTASGQLDTGFGIGGKLNINAAATANGYSEAKAVLVQPDGKILVAGFAFGPGHSEFLLMRLNTNGTPDASFGTGGITRTAVGSSEDIANAMVRQPDGKIVLAGSTYAAGGQRDFALARYSVSGVLDPTFGTGGIVTTAIGPSDDYAYALVLMPWGRLVAAGSARTAVGQSPTDFALAAYNADGGLDRYFGVAGKRIVDVSTTSDVVYGLTSDISGARLWAVGTASRSGMTPNQDFVAVELGLPDTIFRDGFEVTAP